jgi:26S proteasome regulatory subunit N9
MITTEPVVFSRFYMATAEYRKCVGPPQEFYKAALMFLAYTPMEGLTAEQRYVLATDMALASITGEDIFNFGEVIATPILGALKGTPNGWLEDLVMALHRGDIDTFNGTIDAYRTQYFAQPSLAAKHEEIKKKVVLLCLLNIAFERPSHDRKIAFADIASRTRISLDQVEWVCMRAMSLGLLKGTMDEVQQEISVTWVQPRVLDKDQLALLRSQLDGWTEKVKSALLTVEDQTAELFV